MSLTKSTGKPIDIRPATGKLGILTPGMGAVATTFMAGVEAIRKGISKPIGSLTQMGTIRLGKRTDARTPLINEFVPLAKLEDIVFGGWDLFPDDAYQAASKAGVLSKEHLGQLEGLPLDRQADEGGVGAGLREETDRHPLQDRQEQGGPGGAGDGRHQGVQEEEQLRPAGDGLVRLDRGLPRPAPCTARWRPSRQGLAESDPKISPVARSTPTRAQAGRPLRQRRAQPAVDLPGAAWSWPSRTACRSPARTSRPARRS